MQMQDLKALISDNPELPELSGLHLTEQGFISACHQGNMPQGSPRPHCELIDIREELAASATAIWHESFTHLQELRLSTSHSKASLAARIQVDLWLQLLIHKLTCIANSSFDNAELPLLIPELAQPCLWISSFPFCLS